MNKRSLIFALPLAAALAVPSVAQQATTVPAAPPAQSQNLSAPEAEAPREPLQVETKEGFWGKLNPFARKKYVRRQLTPVVGRVNELDELTAANSRMIRDVDSRATEGIRMASLKATEADAKAMEAGNRATVAHETATKASTRLTAVEQVVTNLDQYQTVSEAEIRFRPGQVLLSKKAKEALDEMATSLKEQKGYVVNVQGFSSGSNSLQNSQRMADSVVRYLVIEHEIPVYRIFTVGMGNAKVKSADGSVRRTKGGRVEIALLRNGVSELEQAGAVNQQPPVQTQQNEIQNQNQ